MAIPNKEPTLQERLDAIFKVPCPWCGEDVRGSAYEEWQDGASDEFAIECPKCDKVIRVKVDTSPTFEVEKGKPEDI